MAKQKKVSVTLAQPGFTGRRAKWRIAWSLGAWDPRNAAQGPEYRTEKDAGRAGVDYKRGAASQFLPLDTF